MGSVESDMQEEDKRIIWLQYFIWTGCYTAVIPSTEKHSEADEKLNKVCTAGEETCLSLRETSRV